MWGQVSMNSALRAFLRGETVKVVDFNAETVLSLEEVLQRFSEGVAFFSEAVEEMTEDLPPLARNFEQVSTESHPLNVIGITEPLVSPPATVKVSIEKQKGDDDTSYSSDQVKRMVEKANKRAITDYGKLRALKEAGWTNKAIADEFGCTSQTVANTLKKLEEVQA